MKADRGIKERNMETIIYYTIQHLYEGKGEWVFSCYNSFASAAILEGVFECVYNKGEWRYDSLSQESGFVGLSRVIEANKGSNHKFRLVKVTHVFDVVEPV